MAERFADATESMNEAMSLGGDPEKLAAYYAEWAEEYDDDVASHGYGLPAMMVTLLRSAIDADLSLAWARNGDITILDVGCGTGLVGLAFAEAEYSRIDGVDLSPEMVAVAETRGVYRNLRGGVDITQPAPDDLVGVADVAAVAGVFTVGHVPPESLAIVASMVRPGGLLLASTRQAYYEETDYQDHSDQLIEDDVLDLIVHVDHGPYTMDSTAHYFAYRVNG